MGGAFSGVAAAGDTEGASYPVVLNVYDLTPINNYLHWCGLGIFHSAVEGERCQPQIRFKWLIGSGEDRCLVPPAVVLDLME
jgi:hypothetical protein